jgi:hypothetical protein
MVKFAYVKNTNLTILTRMMIGKMLCHWHWHQHHFIVLTTGEMLVPSNVTGCSRSLMNLESLLQPVATALFF